MAPAPIGTFSDSFRLDVSDVALLVSGPLLFLLWSILVVKVGPGGCTMTLHSYSCTVYLLVVCTPYPALLNSMVQALTSAGFRASGVDLFACLSALVVSLGSSLFTLDFFVALPPVFLSNTPARVWNVRAGRSVEPQHDLRPPQDEHCALRRRHSGERPRARTDGGIEGLENTTPPSCLRLVSCVFHIDMERLFLAKLNCSRNPQEIELATDQSAY